MNFNLRNRISLYYLSLTVTIMFFIFLIIYSVVYFSVYNHLDSDLDLESHELAHSIVILNDTFFFGNHFEWGEAEHKQIEVNPTFIQVCDASGKIIKKSGNLIHDSLSFTKGSTKSKYFNTKLHNSDVRQLQQPIINPTNKILGYIIVAVPLEESEIVLTNFLYSIFIAFPIVALILFIATRAIAGKAIAPIGEIIRTTERITKENLGERIAFPEHKDELYQLAFTVNRLLDRLEEGLFREKQFTSDASHELRTPLSVIKGTLEVLIRKPRSIDQYEEKIKYCISEVDKINEIVEELLLLARFDSDKFSKNSFEPVIIKNLIDEIIVSQKFKISEKNISVNNCINNDVVVISDRSLLSIVFANLISNSIKYGSGTPMIEISSDAKSESTEIIIADNGIGMNEYQLKRLFDPFYRAEDQRSKIPGIGLGLAIVKKISDLLDINLEVKSEPGQGTRFKIIFKNLNF